MSRITLSIITVNYNNREGLKKTIESLQSQSFADYEHIIIDAQSTDGSVEVIKDYAQHSSHLTYWRSEPDKGIYDGMNKGIAQAMGNGGEYLCFLNSGDCFVQDILKDIPFDGTQFLFGNAKMVYKHKERLRIPPAIPDLAYLCNHSLHHQSCFMHRSLFEKEVYDIRYRIVADWAHSFKSLIIHLCSYRYLPFVISECDGYGLSADRKAIYEERIRWFNEQFPPILRNSFISCAQVDDSGFRDVLPLLSKTSHFKIRMKHLVLFLYRIHSLFSKPKD